MSDWSYTALSGKNGTAKYIEIESPDGLAIVNNNPATLKLKVKAIGFTAASYKWYKNETQISTLQEISVSEQGVYDCAVTDSDGGVYSDTVSVIKVSEGYSCEVSNQNFSIATDNELKPLTQGFSQTVIFTARRGNTILTPVQFSADIAEDEFAISTPSSSKYTITQSEYGKLVFTAGETIDNQSVFNVTVTYGDLSEEVKTIVISASKTGEQGFTGGSGSREINQFAFNFSQDVAPSLDAPYHETMDNPPLANVWYDYPPNLEGFSDAVLWERIKTVEPENPTYALSFRGNWDAEENEPELEDGVGVRGYMYIIKNTYSRDLGSGVQTFIAGNRVVYNGSVWEQMQGDLVSSIGYTPADETDINNLKARYDESLRSDDTKFPTYEYDGLTLKACSIRNFNGTSYSTCLSTYTKTGTMINYVYSNGNWSNRGPISYTETLLPVSKVIGDLMFSSFLMQMNPDYYKKTESYNKTEVDALLNLINSKIPSQASSTNQLADKDFVNSTVGTNTSNYISNNGQPFTSLAQLQAYTGTVTNNDYAFVTGTDEQGNTYYDRYKATVSGSSKSWAKEYRLNNSSFTAEQWTAINSGITGNKVTNYDSHLSATNNPHSVTKSQVGLGNVTNVATESTITSGSTKNITSGAVYTALQGKVNTTDTIAVAHGGTGQTTAKGGQYALLGSMNEVTGTPSDSSMWIGRYDSPSASSGAVYYRKFLELWNYIKSKINGNYDIPANKHYGNPSGTTRYIKIDLRDTKASILVSVAYQGSIWFDRNNSNPYRLDSSSYGVTGWAWSSREGTTDKNVLWLKVASYRDISITIPSLTMSQVGTDITATGVQVVFNAWTTTAPTGITFGTTVNQVDTVSARNSALSSYYKAGDDLQINSIGCDGNIEIRNTDSILSVFDIDCTSIDTNGNPITCGKLTSSKVVIPIKASTYTGTDNGEIWIG